MESQACKNCKFWKKIDRFAESADGANVGECRFNPPLTFDDENYGLAKWPLVCENSWCGKIYIFGK